MRICPQCGFENNQDAKFCRSCGSRLEAVQRVLPLCPKCGRPVHTGAKFCRSCGARLEREEPESWDVCVPAAAPVCPRCGKELSPGEKFCRSCGAALSEPEAEVPEQAEEAPAIRAEEALRMAEKAARYISRAVEVSASPAPGESAIDADRIQQAAIAAAVKAMRGGK